MMKKRTLSAQSGFTLVEVMIIVAIIAVVLGAYLSFYKSGQDTDEIIETRQKIDRVLNAVSNFAMTAANNYRLPCPANPRANPTSGDEDTGGGVCASPVGQGIIPYRTLGLTQEDAQDGFGNYMTYIVWQPATTAGGQADLMASRYCDGVTFSAIDLRRNGVAQVNMQRPFVAIISYGPNGVGSYNMRNTNVNARDNPYGDLSALGGVFPGGEAGNIVTPNPATTAGRLDINDYSPAADGNHFDDIIGMMTGQQVVTRLSMTGCN